ncbi:GAF domain-containing sensor histidine kinase [Bacillus thermotolerans]|uniref:GAF domain-containing sensor histidine kinase n=1 Tax=Bacillus thermotolerans TaxID=1221996 RepID=UPI00057C67A9|nr:GAF domain-containing sensor histidine kinase [Bacillus thermotolerans]KKB33316.1 Two-component sensor histidine kinase [Bacillus thermotolerans]
MERKEMIDLLTGVQSSKRNYYTELKTTVEKLKKKNSHLEVMNEVMKVFTVHMSVQEMLKSALAKLTVIYPVERISLALFDGQALRLSYIYPEQKTYLAKGTAFPEDHSLYSHVFATGEVIEFDGSRQTEYFFEKEAFEHIGLRSVVLLPLTCRGHIIGVLTFASSSAWQLEEEDRHFFHHLTDQMAVCVENARLYGEVFASQQRWEGTFRAVSDAIIIISLDGAVLAKNDAALLSWPLSEGKDIRPFIEKAAASTSNPFEQTVLTKKPHYAELRFESKVYDCSCYPLFGKDESLDAVILYSKDVTEKRQMEAQLLHSGKLAAIGEMAAGVAHELNNPLTAIIGNTQLLLRGSAVDPDMKPLLEDIDLCGKRCRTIIRSLLAFSRQEDFSFKPCSLNDAVTEALSLIRRQIEKQNITLDVCLDEPLPMVEGNLQQLSQVAANLLMNAKDALEEVTDRPRTITVKTKQENDHVCLAITDNGPGIQRDHMNDIFHPFFTTKSADRGTGLGLSVSFGIAKAHGGRLSAESIPHQQTTFMLEIPLLDERM